MAVSEPDFAALVAYLRRRLGDGLLAVYLYGSFAKGVACPDSDIDLALLAQAPLPPGVLAELASELMDLCGRAVDLVDLRQVPTVLRMQVITTGRRLWCRDRSACELFETHVLSDYVDLNERRAGILEDIRRRGSIYG